MGSGEETEAAEWDDDAIGPRTPRSEDGHHSNLGGHSILARSVFTAVTQTVIHYPTHGVAVYIPRRNLIQRSLSIIQSQSMRYDTLSLLALKYKYWPVLILILTLYRNTKQTCMITSIKVTSTETYYNIKLQHKMQQLINVAERDTIAISKFVTRYLFVR